MDDDLEIAQCLEDEDFGDTCISLSKEDHTEELDNFKNQDEPLVVVACYWVEAVGFYIKKLENELNELRPHSLN